MIGSFEVELGGKTRRLQFNNYAHAELSKLIFQRGFVAKNPADLVDRLSEMAEENIALLVKAILYAGIIGYDYQQGFTKSITQQEIGVLVGEVDSETLEKMWDVFLDAMGVNLKDLVSRHEIVEGEEESIEKKS